jgi:hypothetical protein
MNGTFTAYKSESTNSRLNSTNLTPWVIGFFFSSSLPALDDDFKELGHQKNRSLAIAKSSSI